MHFFADNVSDFTQTKASTIEENNDNLSSNGSSYASISIEKTEDWAFSNSGLAYNTGKLGRREHQIIRVQPSSRSSRSSKKGVKYEILDKISTETPFAEQELDVETTTMEDSDVISE
ncbi:hypothetical protein FBEOM_3454 [Fusarium beomiforme]|uniref:Uncharacterized protein n=1 Tax=Fusarium beomiforme TaxID=44412 RepID=A0A9P5DZ08_9HYPO|nr:hypothetical protein FBEOM_3454 [Fusarium beomiforme]